MLVISLKACRSPGIDYVSWSPCPSSDYNCCPSFLCWSPKSLTFPMILGAPKLLINGSPPRSGAYWSAWSTSGSGLIIAGSSCFCSSVCCLNSSKVPKRLICRLLRSWGTFLEPAFNKWIVLPRLSKNWKKQRKVNFHKKKPVRSNTTTYVRWKAKHAVHSTSRQWPLSSAVPIIRSQLSSSTHSHGWSTNVNSSVRRCSRRWRSSLGLELDPSPFWRENTSWKSRQIAS